MNENFLRKSKLTINKNFGVSVLIVHGLNTHMNVMNDFVNYFHSQKINTYNVSLRGHRGDLEEIKSVKKNQWLVDLSKGYEKLKKIGGPIFFLGHSLGGLIGMHFLANDLEIKFDGMILFAPAIKLRSYTHLIKATWFMKGRTLLPSLTPGKYKSNKGTSIQAYRELLKAKKEFLSKLKKNTHKFQIPTLLVIDPQDELVSATGLSNMIENNENLSAHWELIKIKSQNTYHHLVIDKVSLGVSQWKHITDKISKITKQI